MPYADQTKRNEYSKLRMRILRGSKLARTDKSVLEQTYENLRNKERGNCPGNCDENQDCDTCWFNLPNKKEGV